MKVKVTRSRVVRFISLSAWDAAEMVIPKPVVQVGKNIYECFLAADSVGQRQLLEEAANLSDVEVDDYAREIADNWQKRSGRSLPESAQLACDREFSKTPWSGMRAGEHSRAVAAGRSGQSKYEVRRRRVPWPFVGSGRPGEGSRGDRVCGPEDNARRSRQASGKLSSGSGRCPDTVGPCHSACPR
jgi:hypothetical protein